jgi:hypothetical protein
MLHAGLDLSRRRLDVCLLSGSGESIAEFATPADAQWGGGIIQIFIKSESARRFASRAAELNPW